MSLSVPSFLPSLPLAIIIFSAPLSSFYPGFNKGSSSPHCFILTTWHGWDLLRKRTFDKRAKNTIDILNNAPIYLGETKGYSIISIIIFGFCSSICRLRKVYFPTGVPPVVAQEKEISGIQECAEFESSSSSSTSCRGKPGLPTVVAVPYFP